MLKKAFCLFVVLVGFAACATMMPPPSLYIERPSPMFTAELSLDDRIAVEEAWNYLRQNRPDKAEKIIARMSRTNPFTAAARGYVAFLLNDYTLAEQNFEQALRDYPDLPVAHVGLGQLYQKTGHEELAYNEYLEVLKNDPENAWAKKEAGAIRSRKTDQYLTEAKTYASNGNVEKSKESYLKALEYSPKLQEAHLALARLYIKEKNHQNALFHLKTASANDPANWTVLKDYADALYQTGQFSRSLDLYERLRELDPADKTAVQRIETLKNRLGIIELPSQYGSILGSEAVTKEDVAALIGIKFRDILSDASIKPPVIVDITTSWASRYIVKVAALEIMEVYSNHTFQPKKTIIRAEMAETLVRLINILKKSGSEIVSQIPLERIRIADVPQEHFYFQPIAQIISYQIMDLAPNRTFKPELNITGQEAIKILDLLLGLIK